MLLIDSSAIVKFFSKEPGWDSIGKYMETSVTLSFAIVELGNALLKKMKKNELDIKTAIELVRGYSDSAILLDQNNHIDTALKIAFVKNLAVYDSLFIATALDEGYDLVSCDAKQIKAADELDIKTIKC